MPLHRRAVFVSSLVVGVSLAACGQGESAKPSVSAPAPVAPVAAAPAPSPAPAVAVAGQYQVPAAASAGALPAQPAAYVFLTASGALWVGTTPVLAEATATATVADVAVALTGAPPPSPAPAPALTGEPDSGTRQTLDEGRMGGGRPAGTYQMKRTADDAAARDRALAEARAAGVVGAGELGPGSSAAIQGTGDLAAGVDDASALANEVGEPAPDAPAPDAPAAYGRVITATRTDAAAARVVLVADRGARIGTVQALLVAIAAPVAVVVDGGGGRPGALGWTLAPATVGGDGSKQLVDAGRSLDDVLVALAALPADVTVSSLSVVSGGMRNGRITLPRFRLGAPSLVGTYPKNQLRRFLRRSMPQLRYCYERQLITTPGLAGTMTVDFVIGKGGDVRQVKAAGFDRAVDRCVEETIKAIAFPAPDAGIVKVSYPLEFAPSGG